MMEESGLAAIFWVLFSWGEQLMAQPNKPTGASGHSRRPGRPTTSSGGKPTRNGSSAGGGKPTRSGGKPTAGGRRPRPGAANPTDRGPRPRRDTAERTEAQQLYDGPPIPDDITASDLDKHTRAALAGIPDKLADKVARHLVMAGLLLDQDPETAYKHALAARARATRTAIVREAVGETAYAAGKYATALAELRTARRLNGAHHYTPIMADCERALGRPDKALTYDTPTTRNKLDEPGNIELTIVIAGARRDLGQTTAALHLLETEPLTTTSRAPWATRLKYTYADTLATAGRTTEAIEWFHRTITSDPHHTTDAPQRITQLTQDV